MASIIQFDQVCYQYRRDKYALMDVTLDIQQQRRTAIVGANGAGKSTLVFHMNGLFLPQSGQVRVQGILIDKGSRNRVVEKVGVVFQDPDDQILSLTVREDVAFGPTQLKLSPDEIEKRVDRYLDLLEIRNLAGENPGELSYGQKKLVAIAGVLAMETEVLIFDEPMAFLDPYEKKKIQSLIDYLSEAGKTVVVATHDMQLVAEWADEVIVMKEGTCLGMMTPKQLFADRDLLKETKLTLPPIAEALQTVWTGPSHEMPISIKEAKNWLEVSLRR